MPTELHAGSSAAVAEQTADITLATELEPGLPGSLIDSTTSIFSPYAEDDRTVLTNPVEQAILVDRTRAPRRSTEPDTAVAPRVRAPLAVAGDTARDVPALSERAEPGLGDVEVDGDGDATSQIFGDYRVVASLPSGGGSPRFLAEHRTLGVPVALVLLEPDLIGSPEAEERFFAEAMVTSRIAHPGVPMVLDFGRDRRGVAYLALEHVEGQTLAAHLAGGGLFSLEQVLAIGAQAAGILAAAHASGVLHRNVAPETIQLCPDAADPSGLRIRLRGFGEAKDEPAMLGSPWYVAPEQSLGAAGVDARADVYGLGCVLYHLLAGRPPFTGAALEVVMARRTLDPPPPSAHRRDIPPPLDSLVHRMVSRRRRRRPGSMAVVERELRALLLGHDLAEVELSVRPRWRRGWPIARAQGQRWVAGARAAALRHPRWSVALIATSLFAGAVGVVVVLA